MKVNLIAAIDDKNGLAKNGSIPWDLPSDKQQFREKTLGKTVILGKRTYDEMRPMLGDRHAIVVSREDEVVEDAENIHDLPAFLEQSEEEVWVIGGGQIFSLALPFVTEMYLTRVHGDFACDVFFPVFEDTFELIRESAPQEENGITFTYQLWRPKR